MITENLLRSLFKKHLKEQEFPIEAIYFEGNLVTFSAVIDHLPISIAARFRAPRRKKSLPEVTMLPNPYANSLTIKVKTAILNALEETKELIV